MYKFLRFTVDTYVDTYFDVVTLYLLIIFVYLANDRKPTYFTFYIINNRKIYALI
jgi:hypothetical protein